MANKILIGVFIIAAIVLTGVFLGGLTAPAPPVSNITISNFTFVELSTGPTACHVNVEGRIMFQGPITKPTPCNGLTANYTISDETIRINITTTPFEGFCSEVLQDTFYKGSFDLLQSANVQIYYGGEKICDKTLLITSSEKEQACINSGGTVTTAMCCNSTTDDFPNTCVIGACGCSLENSHSIQTCNCGEGKCFNGSACVQSYH